MPYLSPMWTLVEAAAWISTRKPEFVDKVVGQHGGTALAKLNEMRDIIRATRQTPPSGSQTAKLREPSDGDVERILEELASGILSGQLQATARNIDTGARKSIPVTERRSLEFHIADDLPGRPFGFRNRSDRILRWDVMRSWPHQSAR